MLFFARLYATRTQAEAAVAEYVEIGYAQDSVVMLTSSPAAPAYEGAPVDGGGDDRETAVRAGQFMGEHAEFYVSRVRDGVCLVVAAPPFIASAKAESILDSHDPLPDSHLPPREPFVPWSEQATPFSNMLGWPALTKSGTPFSDTLGFGFKQEGLSHLSRWFKPLANDFTVFPMGTKASRDTIFPMGTKASKDTYFPMGTRSKRLEGKNSSFGIPLLSKRKFYMTAE